MELFRSDDILRFWAKVHIGAENECWPWKASKGNPGYGHMWVYWNGVRRCVDAHKIAYMIVNGEVPRGLYVLHTCDFRPCCNPAHTWAGTQRENIHDAAKKGRQQTLVSPAVARLLASAVNMSPLKRQALAAEYSVPTNYIRRVQFGKTLSPVTGLKPPPPRVPDANQLALL